MTKTEPVLDNLLGSTHFYLGKDCDHQTFFEWIIAAQAFGEVVLRTETLSENSILFKREIHVTTSEEFGDRE